MVTTVDGDVQGVVASGVSIFRGLPYGAPTDGANRFLPPRPPAPWTGVRDARLYGATAAQARTFLADGGFEGNRPTRGEDCLVLNVWTPSPDAARRPVMVWLHGGGFEAGTGSVLLYDGVNLCRAGDVVVVTINHRLGVLGHLHLADLVDDPDVAGSGNAGFLDVVAALRWVRENIECFGGDPGNVTIFGQSGGGRKVSLAAAAPAAAGLFHRGIVQSGSQLRLTSRARAHERAEQLLAQLDLPPRQWRRLQELPWRDVLRAARSVRGRFGPVVDDVVFDRDPWAPDAPPTASAVPMMIGTCRTELSLQLGMLDPTTFAIDEADLPARLAPYVDADDVDRLTAIVRRSRPDASAPEVFFTIATARTYWRDAQLQTEAKARQAGGAPVWSYRVMWRTPVDGGRLVSPHNLDLPFVFANVEHAPHIVGPPSDQTRAMAEVMSHTWLAFARTGDPGNETIPEWRPYDLERRSVLHLDVPPVVIDDPFPDERAVIERYESQQARSRRRGSAPA
ncbi:carboxylesterase/lipase family protein [Iamia sp. SCSIO 61187]|nr:carboxylesterase/lipase family protein [Iamia sp. SCSIO 61187]